jgi:hypothetical protein
MTQPKHLWSGDWERDSAAAAEDLANLRPRTWPQRPDMRETERPTLTPTQAPTPTPAPVQATPPVSPPTEPRQQLRPQQLPPEQPRRSEPQPRPAPLKKPHPRQPQPHAPRARRRIGRHSTRAALLGLVALLLVVGAAYGLSTLGGSNSTSAATAAAWLGARLESTPAGGALVNSVTPGSPAASAGLKPGDVIIQIQGRPVSAAINVSSAVSALNVGDTLQIVAVRMGHEFATTVLLQAQPPASP